MRILYLQLCLLVVFCNTIKAQEIDTTSIGNLFLKQISSYPHEKIYVQTDRDIYVSGEVIWFRIHLVDALFLKQANASRYVYLELINPIDKVVERVKIRPDSTGCFYGQLQLSKELEEGNYLLRGYTRFMQNQGEDYFFHKTIYVTDPLSRKISPEISFSEEKDKIQTDIRFFNKTGKTKIIPEQCLIFPNGDPSGEGEHLLFKEGVAQYSFKRGKNIQTNKFLLQATFNNIIYNRYIDIPSSTKTFDVSFFPEGGHAQFSTAMKIAFKATNENGLSEEIKGQIFDDQGNAYTTFESLHLGMGRFRMYYLPGKKYYAICTNKNNVSKRFDLPEASENSVSLKTTWHNNILRITLAKSPGHKLPPQTQLIAHIRGAVIYAQPWNDKVGYLNFEKDFFPAGIVHFLLIDESRNILSERLVFSSQSSTFAKTNIIFNKKKYNTRDKIDLTIQIMDENRIPLTGNLSLSIVDKKDADVDTTSNIISTLLLSSELKGYIESPSSYLQKNNKQSTLALDVLMMTQGWRRYNVPDILKGKITQNLQYPVESNEEVTGKAEKLFSTLKQGDISLLAIKDSVIGTFLTQPDENGRFVFKNIEYPEGTRYIVQALTPKGSKKVFIELDPPKPFPALPKLMFKTKRKTQIKSEYESEINEKHLIEDGMRIYNLAEVVVTAKRNADLKTKSPYYSINSSKVLTSKDVEKGNIISIFDLLRRIPGLTVIGDEVRHRNTAPLVVLDNVPEENFDYDRLNVNDISDVFLSPPISAMPIFGGRAAGGAVVINTKKGFVERNKINSNIQVFTPIGYQQTVEFYSPVYATQREKDSTVRDLRTTIYWNPNVQVDSSGSAKISFYSADFPTQYGIILEGISSEGHIIYSSGKEITVERGAL
ncbi:MG2 domain-containing protein [uncultured Bacteroides sp.]|uniref:MG2 domain-containing protein n=1 Tax=uncultured Bacteroides sp. TaxID=162156 RepID=UPI002AAB1B5F|nr:MG2 domain-containing protein [uncultured Bacteroides sp.]